MSSSQVEQVENRVQGKFYQQKVRAKEILTKEFLYDEIINFIGSNFGNIEMNFGRSKNPKSVSRSNNFQYFLEYNGSLTVANKFFK